MRACTLNNRSVREKSLATYPNIAVRLATTENVVVVSALPSTTIDGKTLIANDLVLVRHQDAPLENGIYKYNGTALIRVNVDGYTFDTFPGSFLGVLVSVFDGYTYGGSVWQ